MLIVDPADPECSCGTALALTSQPRLVPGRKARLALTDARGYGWCPDCRTRFRVRQLHKGAGPAPTQKTPDIRDDPTFASPHP